MSLIEMPEKISRRRFCKIGFGTMIGAEVIFSYGCSGNASRQDPNRLNIYCWADYFRPEAISEFERRNGINVTYDTFASNEQLLAKLQAGATEYDIIMPSSYMLQQLVRMNLIAVLDHTQLKGIDDMMPQFKDPSYDRRLAHSVPQFWGTTGIAYDSRAISAGHIPNDWNDFWDSKFANRMTLLDDSRETIGMALKRLGHSYNCVEEKEVALATRNLIEQKPMVMCYTSDQVIVQLTAGDSLLSMVYSGDAFQAAKSNKDVQYVIPRNGTSLWVDSFCVPKTAPHVANAYKWLNFMLEPEVAAANATFNRFATANQSALKLLKPEDLANKSRYPDGNVLSKCEELNDIGRAVFLYDRMWTELKCS
jgi:spermidine/putrescine transport system substrate-binding protein